VNSGMQNQPRNRNQRDAEMMVSGTPGSGRERRHVGDMNSDLHDFGGHSSAAKVCPRTDQDPTRVFSVGPDAERREGGTYLQVMCQKETDRNQVRVRYIVRVEWQRSQRYSLAIVNGRRGDERRAQPSLRHPSEIVRSIELFHSSDAVINSSGLSRSTGGTAQQRTGGQSSDIGRWHDT